MHPRRLSGNTQKKTKLNTHVQSHLKRHMTEMDILVKIHKKCMFTYPYIISRFKESNSSYYGKFVTFYFQRSVAINIKIKHHQEPLKCRLFFGKSFQSLFT